MLKLFCGFVIALYAAIAVGLMHQSLEIIEINEKRKWPCSGATGRGDGHLKWNGDINY